MANLTLSEVDILNIIGGIHKDSFVFTIFTPDEPEWEIQICSTLAHTLDRIEEIIDTLEDVPQLREHYLLIEDMSITISFPNASQAEEVHTYITEQLGNRSESENESV